MNKSCSNVLLYNTEGPVLYWYCYFSGNDQYPILSDTTQKWGISSKKIPIQKVEDMRNWTAWPKLKISSTWNG